MRVSVHQPANYPDYLAAARPTFEKFGAKFIVRGGAFELMEGQARDRNVVVEFADLATATACSASRLKVMPSMRPYSFRNSFRGSVAMSS